jgi:high-affinity Fe2+/Pb2+ permease
VASFSIVFGILFLSYGLAAVIENYFKVAGSGFLIVGIIVLLVGLMVFSSMKKK